MKRTLKKVLFCTVLAAVTLFAGCKKKTDVDFDKNVVFKEEPLNMEIPDSFFVYGTSTNGSKIVLYGTQTTDKDQYLWAEYDITSGQFTTHEFKFTGENVTDGYINDVRCLADGSVLLSYSTYFEDDSDPDNYIWENTDYLEIVDSTGKSIVKKEVSEVGIDWIGALTSTNDNQIIVNCDSKLYLLDYNLKVVGKNEISENCWVDRFVTGRNNQIYAYGSFSEKYGVVVPVSLPGLELGAAVEFPSEGYYTPIGGSDAYEWLLSDDKGVYGYNTGDEKPTILFDFVNSDVAVPYFDNIVALDDKNYIGFSSIWDDMGSHFETYRYTKVNPEDIVDKKIISLGCVYLDSDFRKSIVDFNKSNEEYRIVVKDYNQYSTEEDYMAGYNRFDSDIMTGRAPDIVISNTSLEKQIQKGVLKDLRSYAEKDPDVNLDDIFPNLIEVLSKDDKLYAVTPSFMLEGYVGKKSILGDRTSWTIQEMREFANTLPANMSLIGDSYTRDSVLYMFMMNNYNSFIDPLTNECHFDSQDFIDVLEFAKSFPKATDDFYENIDYSNSQSAWRENRTVLYDFYCYDVSSYLELIHGYFGEPVTFVGYPSTDGQGFAIIPSKIVAITSKANYPEVCWDFIKTVWTDQKQSTITWGIPASMSRFDEMAEECKHKPYYMDGNQKVEYDRTFWMGDSEIPMAPLTDAEISEFKEFIKTVNKQMNVSNDEQIFTIVEEEVAPYFEDQKSVEEVVKIIQSRITIYVNEKQ